MEPTTATNNRPKKIRLTETNSLIDRIKRLPLETKLELLGLLTASIEEDKNSIQEQIAERQKQLDLISNGRYK